MRDNIIIATLKQYDKCTNEKKLNWLQMIENHFAEEQGRKARKVVIKVDRSSLNAGERLADALGILRKPYESSTPNYIYLPTADSECAIYVIYNLIYAGYQAYLDDYMNGKAKKLDLYSSEKDFTPDEIIIGKALENEIKNYVNSFARSYSKDKNNPVSYESGLVSEQLGNLETTALMLDNIISSVETVDDYDDVKYHIIDIFYNYVSSINRLNEAESEIGISYDSLMNEFYQNEAEKIKKLESVEFGNILYSKNPMIRKMFEKIYPHAAQYMEIEQQDVSDEKIEQVQKKQETLVKKVIMNDLKLFIFSKCDDFKFLTITLFYFEVWVYEIEGRTF